MATGYRKLRSDLRKKAEELVGVTAFDWMREATQKWLDTYDDTVANSVATDEFVAALEKAILPIDNCIDFWKSEGKKIYGAEVAAQKLEEAMKAKKAGSPICPCHGCELESELLANKDFLAKRSQWIFGGDGWAYDSVSAVWTTCWPAARMSTCSCSTRKFTPTLAVSLQRLLLPVLSPSLPLPVRRSARKTSA